MPIPGGGNLNVSFELPEAWFQAYPGKGGGMPFGGKAGMGIPGGGKGLDPGC